MALRKMCIIFITTFTGAKYRCKVLLLKAGFNYLRGSVENQFDPDALVSTLNSDQVQFRMCFLGFIPHLQ